MPHSFTEAGRQLSLSSSAIGKAVARLEDRLGVRLFHRSTRSITLTQEGKLFLESCRRIISDVARIEQEFAQTKTAPKGRLRVSLPIRGMLFGPSLSKLMLTYPHIELDLDFDDRLVDVISEGYDVAIRTKKAVIHALCHANWAHILPAPVSGRDFPMSGIFRSAPAIGDCAITY